MYGQIKFFSKQASRNDLYKDNDYDSNRYIIRWNYCEIN